tara:strand:+ start:137 stop:946 length:810 start_codon:yes stop_codon:yes gene_type:complete
METNFTSKSTKIFICKKCDFECSKKGDYNRHISTTKHKKKHLETKITSFTSNQFVCECGKEYKSRAGLFKHKKKCNNEKKNLDKDTMKLLLKDNIEMKKTIIEFCKKIEPISINNTNNINSNNNNIFNIQVFLNEDCKDAMNITEFIESIQLSIEDIEKIGIYGQTEGISKLFINKLQNLDIVKRPVHCSDLKNQIIFVKDQDKWEEETNNNPKLKEALDKITVKTIDKLPEVVQDPEKYMKTISEVSRDPRDDKEIINNIAKEVCVEN